MEPLLSILGIAGSLRSGSYNKMLLETAKAECPDGAEIGTFDRLGEIPLFNEDIEPDLPDAVVELKEKIRTSDAVLFVTPEYNYSVPGVLKNAIDWASRPYGDNSWWGKPAGIMGASPSMLGTVRAQMHLRQSFVFLNMHAYNMPEVIVPAAHQRFDEHGRLQDEATLNVIREMLDGFVHWIRVLQRAD